MASHYLLYTVTGGREVFYAAVDRETDRVWTSPTKEGAQRQAQDAGLDNFTEQIISKDALLESLGVADDHHLRIHPDRTERPPREEEPAPKSPAPWFVAGEGHDGATPASKDFSLPRRLKGAKKRLPKGKSPFAAKPISPHDAGGDDDDVLTSPSQSDHAPDVTPFTDEPPDEATQNDVNS